MATKKKVAKKAAVKKAAVKKPRKLKGPPAISCVVGATPTGTTPKTLRDLIYAWLYVTVGQIGNVDRNGNSCIIASQVKTCLQANAGVIVTDTLLQDIIGWIEAIQQDDDGALLSFMNLLKNSGVAQRISQPWSGTSDHPELGELNNIFVP